MSETDLGSNATPVAGGAEVVVLNAVHRCLLAQLRQPFGVFAQRWAAFPPPSANFEEGFDLRVLAPLCAVWARWSSDVARELVQSAANVQGYDGSFPAFVTPGNRVSSLRAWPNFATAAWVTNRVAPSADFLAWLIPSLERYLEWAWRYYDVDHGPPRWPQAEESWIPEIWQPDVRTVDLTVFLLLEFEAGLFLVEHSHVGGIVSARWAARVRQLSSHLQFFFDGASGIYRDRAHDGRFVARRTLCTFLPLLVPSCPPGVRARLAHELTEWYDPQRRGFRAWEPWPEDESAPPVRVEHQPFLMWALVRHMTPEAQSFIQRILAQAAGRTIEHVMEAVSLALGTAPAGAPACEGLPVAHRPWTWAAAVVGMLLLFGTGWHMMHRPSLPGTTGEALLNLARERYDAGDHAAVIALCQEFLAISKATNGPVRVLLGNAFYRTGRYRDAEVEYRAALQDEASSLHALYNLGLALYHQGREEEAAHVFEQFAEAYRTDYPELASRARIALSLIRRNPSSPEPTIH